MNEPFPTTFAVRVGFKEVTLLAVHHDYLAPFISLEVGGTCFTYQRRRDHELLSGRMGNF